MKIQFLGGAGTVTGSKTVLQVRDARLLVDCGLFVGSKDLRSRNWAEPEVDPSSFTAVALTHAHLDHSGYLPVLVRRGFRGPVYCTPGTRDLSQVLLTECARLMAEDAAYLNEHEKSRHHPALPLFSEAEAMAAIDLLRPVPSGHTVEIQEGLTLRFTRAGHLLGSACLHIETPRTRLVFSGDVGRLSDPVWRPPEPLGEADILILESTSGVWTHPAGDPERLFGELLRRVIGRGGVVLVPTSAIGRSQMLLHFYARLRYRGEVPDVPVFLDSPVAVDVTHLYGAHPEDHRLSHSACVNMGRVPHHVSRLDQSRSLSANRFPMVVFAGSGMLGGGRVLHHLKAFGPDERNAIVLAGYQAPGTRGEALLKGARSLRIHGEDVPIRAEVVPLAGLSAHADCQDLVQWLEGLDRPPRHVFINHGERENSEALRDHLVSRFGWNCTVAHHQGLVKLDETQAWPTSGLSRT